MGYELKMYLALKHDNSDYRQIVGMVDLCKVNNKLGDFISDSKSKSEDVFIYALDGNTKIFTDSYGDKLWEIEVETLLPKMITENKKNPYRRLKLAIPMMKALLKDFKESKPVAIFYGY